MEHVGAPIFAVCCISVFIADNKMHHTHVGNVLSRVEKGMTVSVHTETHMVVTQQTWPCNCPNRTEYMGTFEEIVDCEVTCLFYGSDYLQNNLDVLVLSNATSTCSLDGLKRYHRKTHIVLNTIIGVLLFLCE